MANKNSHALGKRQLTGMGCATAAKDRVQCSIIIREHNVIPFSNEEKELDDTLFKDFAAFDCMKLMRIGNWREAKPGQVLTVEGEPLDEVMLIYDGRLGVETNGKEVAQLQDGNFIGEVSFISGGAATATVRAVDPTRYVSWSKKEIEKLLNRNPSMKFAMQAVFSTDLSKKLARRAPTFQGKIHLPS